MTNTSKHLADMHAKLPGYLRTTRFKLLYARSNAESRAFKGESAVAGEKPVDKPPKWLAIHEYELSVEEVSIENIKKLTASPWKDKVKSKVVRGESNQWFPVKSFGEGEWFHGDDYKDFHVM